ncbi:hypothetical protein [Paenibacillus tengchongensis]|uniref:hypothetical protein n=1 Tax=Paenibacillus tengchongensis TaxID=2608684 RepID=UPI00124C88B6|nr:hypothetical protein [Paenibacillus tengchongensis]
MSDLKEYVLVCAPTKAGEQFIRILKCRGYRVAGLANCRTQQARLEELGVEASLLIDTHHENTWCRPDFAIGRVYLFENSVALCSRYVRMCRSWTDRPIIVITTSPNPRHVYKGLGADHVIYSYSGNVSFLADRTAMQG